MKFLGCVIVLVLWYKDLFSLYVNFLKKFKYFIDINSIFFIFIWIIKLKLINSFLISLNIDFYSYCNKLFLDFCILNSVFDIKVIVLINIKGVDNLNILYYCFFVKFDGVLYIGIYCMFCYLEEKYRWEDF